jgi:hypothetical protein
VGTQLQVYTDPEVIALLSGLDAAELRALHLRLGELHEASARHPLTVAYHLHHTGETEACLRGVRRWLAARDYQRLMPHCAARSAPLRIESA